MSFSWTYFWLAAGGLLLVLALLSSVYVLAWREREWARRVARSEVLQTVDRLLSERLPWLWRFIRQRFSIHEWHGLALTVAAVLLFTAVYVFVLITESWTEEEALYAFDRRVYDFLIETANGSVVAFMRIMTRLGDGLTVSVVSVALGAVLLAKGRRWDVVALGLSVGVGSGLMHGLKWVFERSRPEEQIIRAVGHSFPSGHAFMATTLYGWLIYLTWRLVRNDAIRIAATTVLTFAIFLTGMSRVILQVHWASDVAGGFAIGFAWLVLSLVLVRMLRFQYGDRPRLRDAAHDERK